jgi:hypothetical protein
VDTQATTCDFTGNAKYPLIADGTVWFRYCDEKDGSLATKNGTLLNNTFPITSATVRNKRRGHKHEKKCGDYHYKLPLSMLSEPLRTLNASLHAKFKTSAKSSGIVTCPIRKGEKSVHGGGSSLNNSLNHMTAVFTGKTNRTVIVK